MTVSESVEAEIRRLFFAEHWPVGTICRQLGVHDDVVRRVAGLLSPRRVLPSEPSLVVTPYTGFIAEVLAQFPTLRATRIFDMVRARGYDGSVRSIRAHVARVRPPPKREAFLRITPLIGEQAQVDWAHAGTIDVDGGQRALWLFVIVLAWSRAMWGEFVIDLSAHSLARSLCRAMEFFGGNTRQWLFDNPKIVVTERVGDAIKFHPLLLDVASHHHVQPRLCAPRAANQKGTVERTIRLARERFLAGRMIHSLAQGNAELLQFIDEIAQARPHPTIGGRTVKDCLDEERAKLLPLPEKAFFSDVVMPVAVDKTAFIRFDTNSYSVPSKYASSTLTVSADDRVVHVLDGGDVVAFHERSYGKRRVIEDPEHRRTLLEEKRGAREAKGRDRIRIVAPRIDELVLRWAEEGRNLGAMTAQVLRLLDLYGTDVFRASLDALLDRKLFDPGALALLCEQTRKGQHGAPVVEPKFSDHVKDRDVIPHPLEKYDARRRR
jgi:transposase